eukprot:2730433-Amphidinium_carterae.1
MSSIIIGHAMCPSIVPKTHIRDTRITDVSRNFHATLSCKDRLSGVVDVVVQSFPASCGEHS